MLANYAEDNGGPLYIQGGCWDTMTVASPRPPEAPSGVFGIIRGFFVARLMFHQTETNRDHHFEVVIVDADGAEVGRIAGDMRVVKVPGLPPTWGQGVNVIIPLTGLGLPHPGEYRI